MSDTKIRQGIGSFVLFVIMAMVAGHTGVNSYNAMKEHELNLATIENMRIEIKFIDRKLRLRSAWMEGYASCLESVVGE